MSLVPLMRMPAGLRGSIVTALALALGVSSTVNVCKHFIRFEQEEVGDFDAALGAMKPRAHVAGLIFDKTSTIVDNVAFLHFVSYYQAEKGGIVQFSQLRSPVLARALQAKDTTRRRGPARACGGSGRRSRCHSASCTRTTTTS